MLCKSHRSQISMHHLCRWAACPVEQMRPSRGTSRTRRRSSLSLHLVTQHFARSQIPLLHHLMGTDERRRYRCPCLRIPQRTCILQTPPSRVGHNWYCGHLTQAPLTLVTNASFAEGAGMGYILTEKGPIRRRARAAAHRAVMPCGTNWEARRVWIQSPRR